MSGITSIPKKKILCQSLIRNRKDLEIFRRNCNGIHLSRTCVSNISDLLSCSGTFVPCSCSFSNFVFIHFSWQSFHCSFKILPAVARARSEFLSIRLSSGSKKRTKNNPLRQAWTSSFEEFITLLGILKMPNRKGSNGQGDYLKMFNWIRRRYGNKCKFNSPKGGDTLMNCASRVPRSYARDYK